MRLILSAGLIVSLALLAVAHGDHKHEDTVANNKNEIVTIVKTVASEWGRGNGKVFRQYYDDDPVQRQRK